MNRLFTAALEVQAFLQQRNWPFCIIGGLNLVRWGDARTTKDVDLTLFTDFGNETNFIRPLVSNFKSRRTDAAGFAESARVLMLIASNGVPIDIALAGFPYEFNMVTRATDFEFAPGVTLRTASAEDMVVLKTFADRDQDWIDVKGILVRQGDKLDWDYIHEALPPLCELKESPEIVTRLEELRRNTRD